MSASSFQHAQINLGSGTAMTKNETSEVMESVSSQRLYFMLDTRPQKVPFYVLFMNKYINKHTYQEIKHMVTCAFFNLV